MKQCKKFIIPMLCIASGVFGFTACADDEAFTNSYETITENVIDESRTVFNYGSSVSAKLYLKNESDKDKFKYLVYSTDSLNFVHWYKGLKKADLNQGEGCFDLSDLSTFTKYYYFLTDNDSYNYSDHCHPAKAYRTTLHVMETFGSLESKSMLYEDWDGSERDLSDKVSTLGVSVDGKVKTFNKQMYKSSWSNSSVIISSHDDVIYLYAPYNQDYDNYNSINYVLLKGIYESQPENVVCQRLKMEGSQLNAKLKHAYVRLRFKFQLTSNYPNNNSERIEKLELKQTNEVVPTYGYMNLDNNKFDYYTTYDEELLYSTSAWDSFSKTSIAEITRYVLPTQKAGTITLTITLSDKTTYSYPIQVEADSWKMGETHDYSFFFDGIALRLR